MTRNELYAYDKQIIRHLEMKELMPKLKNLIDDQFGILTQMKSVIEIQNEGADENIEIQGRKHVNDQAEQNRDIKDEDSFYKYMAFAGTIEKKRRDNIEKTRKDYEHIYGQDTFEEVYLDELHKGIKKEPRPVNLEDLKQKIQPKKFD